MKFYKKKFLPIVIILCSVIAAASGYSHASGTPDNSVKQGSSSSSSQLGA